MKFFKLKSASLVTVYTVLTCLSVSVSATESDVPEVFKGQDQSSTFSIAYDDFDKILTESVWDLGRSDRAIAPKPMPITGSKLAILVKRKTAMEGNRFYFQNFHDEKMKLAVTKIRSSLEQVPSEVSLSEFNRNEQLAYWLNLYNISLLEQLIAIYPVKKIGRTLYNDGIMSKKLLTVSGVKLSLDDIKDKIILGKFSDNPDVMYGLFQGTIGGPNLRPEAYTGKLVMNQLADNAAEFINSNRGTYQGTSDQFRVSDYYLRYKQLFPNFDKDLKAHLSTHLEGKLANSINNTGALVPNIDNMNIVDFAGGLRSNPSAVANSTGALLSVPGLVGQELSDIAGSNGGGFSEYQIKLLTKMKTKSSNQNTSLQSSNKL